MSDLFQLDDSKKHFVGEYVQSRIQGQVHLEPGIFEQGCLGGCSGCQSRFDNLQPPTKHSLYYAVVDISGAVAVGTVVVGVSAYFINAALDRRAQAARMRTDAYLDFCRAQNTMSVIQNKTDPEFKRMDALSLDAKNRILIYGSPEVVQALRNLQSCKELYTTKQGLALFTQLLSAMRKDAVGGSLSEDVVARVLVFPRGEDLRELLPERSRGRH